MNWSLDFYNTSIVCNHLNRKALFKLKKIKKNIKKVTLHNEFFRKESTSKKLLNNRLDWINLEFTSLSRPYVKKKKS